MVGIVWLENNPSIVEGLDVVVAPSTFFWLQPPRGRAGAAHRDVKSGDHRSHSYPINPQHTIPQWAWFRPRYLDKQ
jgi:hypothetical protein